MNGMRCFIQCEVIPLLSYNFADTSYHMTIRGEMSSFVQPFELFCKRIHLADKISGFSLYGIRLF